MKTSGTRAVSRASWELLRLLTTKVRIASDVQLECADRRWSRTNTAELVQCQLLSEVRVSLAAPPGRRTPLATWQPGDRCPDCGAIAWQGRQRIRQTRPRRLRVYCATHHAANLVGGIGGKLRQPWQLQHDLGVTAVYLHLRRDAPERAEHWISEDLYRQQYGQKRGEKIADGFVVSSGGVIQQVMEFVGDYSAGQLREFHAYWSRRRTAYELR